MPVQNTLTDEELARLTATMRVADPAADNGAFTSLTTIDATMWLILLGMKEAGPDLQRATMSKQEQKELALKKLRLALWDVQRLDLLFPGHVYSERPNFRLTRLQSWPNWQDAHPELTAWKVGPQLHGFEDVKRLSSYVMWHFNTMAFTQAEIAHSVNMNPPKNIASAWIGTKKIMSNASVFTTCYGGKDTPFLTYFSSDRGPGTSMLIMEILDVKQAAWPEPDAKFLQQLKASQESKYGAPADGPLHLLMQSPKVPVVVVRYSYLEGRPAGCWQFTLHLESVLKKRLPKGTSAADLRRALQEHLGAGEEMPEVHLRMFARLLAYNAGLIDGEWASDLQSRWNISAGVAKETRVSFFVPCPRIRFRALEEIETGDPVVAIRKCKSCGKDAP